MSKEIEGDTKWNKGNLLSFMSKEIEKKNLEINEKSLDKQKKICYNIYDLSRTRSMLLRRRGTVSLPSASFDCLRNN